MKKNTSWKFTDESSVTFQLSVSGAGEFGPTLNRKIVLYKLNCFKYCLSDCLITKYSSRYTTILISKYAYQRKNVAIMANIRKWKYKSMYIHLSCM